MLKRLIPLILIDRDYQAVKTQKFNRRVYVGDPLNLIKIYNELGVDEVALFAIDRRSGDQGIDIDFLAELAGEARMPLSYGGGINKLEEVQNIVSVGYEKVAFSFSSWVNSEIPNQASKRLGASGVQAVINFRATMLGRLSATCHRTGKSLCGIAEAISKTVEIGAGEIILQSMDRDGTKKGLDTRVINEIESTHRVPIILAGGLKEHKEAIEYSQLPQLAGVASGTCFTFSSERNGVLPSYPSDLARGI